jgi:hypothetical protein
LLVAPFRAWKLKFSNAPANFPTPWYNWYN